MRIHGGYIVGLMVAVVGASAYVGVTSAQDRANRHDLRSATTLAHAISAPSGATVSHDCHGDGQVACWTSPADVTSVAQDVATSMHRKGGSPTVDCHRGECNVMARFGSHVTAAFVTPVRPDGGSLVSLSIG